MFTDEFIEKLGTRVADILVEKVEIKRQPRLMDIDEAADYMGMTRKALEQKKARGYLPEELTKQIGGMFYWDRVRIDAWLDEGCPS